MPSLSIARGPSRVLVLPPTVRDGELTTKILDNAGAPCLVCANIDHLCEEMEAGAGAVLIAEEHLLGDKRRRLRGVLERQPPWSDIPVLVLTLPDELALASLREWQQEANITLVTRPLRIDNFLAMVRSRLRDRRRQYVVRGLLESLEQRGREFQQLADAMPQMVFIADVEGRIEFLNQRAVDILGSGLERPVGFAECFAPAPEDAGRVASRWRDAVESQQGFACEFRVLHGDSGAYRWQLARAEVVRDAAGGVRQWYGTCTDIHDRKVAEEKLGAALRQSDAANLAKSEFLANMSHEIRTPMTAVLGYSELLAEQESDPEKLAFLEVIQRNGAFLLEIINDILDLSKIEAGKLDVTLETVDLRRFVGEIESLLAMRAGEKGVRFQVELDAASPPAIRVDPKRLRQVLINLVGNAIKFTDDGSVKLAVGRDGQRMRFVVSDTGIGMTGEQLHQLFKPFQQADSSVSRQYGGTGLGLAISQRLAAMLGGEISVRSVPGAGSEFTLELVFQEPVAAGPTPTPTPLDPEPTLTAFDNLEVLVVDDRRDIRFLSGRILSDAGANVKFAEDGLEATRFIERCMAEGTEPRLVLMDMQMPAMDGYEATQRLRAIGFKRPIIALTADAMQTDITRCLESGCDAYLSKPIDKVEMLRTVAYHLSLSEV
ncbi:Sensory/regulatory protein RpfC [Posidoniimonas polymericola]|uniref:histidine kinase n=1 Tax=Posidoniimonas polymericola TaxID=2528002 RepID=A0A5C5YRN6_9BACT|nr:PAS domain-containing sensor histidine kinase [Posidoniimonas polymericola]TWT77634.1 Sensory/regulatory protein RpfC [Posidoniimonas polymericola]